MQPPSSDDTAETRVLVRIDIDFTRGRSDKTNQTIVES